MTDFRDMELVTALARHRHFARAAEDCGISQPAFSARISNLETTLGVAIVQRGNRFLGFTAEGERVLSWAQRILADLEGMRQDLALAKGTLSGRMVLAAVPTALSYTSKLSSLMRERYPDLTIKIQSASSKTIRQEVDAMEVDAGITYLDGAFPKHMSTRHLYDERYVLLVPRALAPRGSGEVTWEEASKLPLCLLSSEMQNRKIIDAVFDEIGEHPNPVVETNAFTAVLSHVAAGAVATIAPVQLADSLPHANDVVELALIGPVVSKPIGLVTIQRTPELPTVTALSEALDSQTD